MANENLAVSLLPSFSIPPSASVAIYRSKKRKSDDDIFLTEEQFLLSVPCSALCIMFLLLIPFVDGSRKK